MLQHVPFDSLNVRWLNFAWVPTERSHQTLAFFSFHGKGQEEGEENIEEFPANNSIEPLRSVGCSEWETPWNEMNNKINKKKKRKKIKYH